MNNRYSKFTILISNINKYINKIKTEEMSEFGLKAVHVSCLFYLNKHEEGLTASQLCHLCEEDKALISRSLDYLEEQGLVLCKNNEENNKKYRAKLFLTKQGKEIADKITKLTTKSVEDGSLGISESDRETMYKSLEIISDNLKKICDNFGDK